MKKLKTTLKQVVEKCCVLEDSSRIQLLGSKEGCECYNKHHDNKINLDEENSFSNNFSTDDKFYYRMAVFRDNIKIFTETGIGDLEEEESKTFLNREHSLLLHDHIANQPVFNAKLLSSQEIKDDYYCMVECAPLDNLLQLMLDPNVLIFNNKYGWPSALYVEDGCVVGRINEEIASIPILDIFKDNSFSGRVLESLSNHEEEITLASSCLISLSKINFNSNATLVEDEKAGTVIYDPESKRMKFFDGSNWQTLSVES